jgi:hypothetical protein
MFTSTWQRRAGAGWLVTLLAQAVGLYGAGPSMAWAGSDAPRVVVVPMLAGDGADAQAAEKFTRLLRDELQARDEALNVVSMPTVEARKPAPAARQDEAGGAAAAQKGLELIQAGQDALSELRFDEAVEKLKAGIDAQLAAPAWAVFDKVKEAQLALAQACFRTQDDRGTKDAFSALARLDPAYTLEEGRFPPAFSQELEKARKRLGKLGRGTVTVEGPAGSAAFLDGRELGMAPATAEVPLGLHYVRVDGPAGERFGQVLDLQGKEGKVRAVFSGGGARAAAQAEEGADPFPSPVLDVNAVYRMVQLCKASGARYALVGLVYKSGSSQLTANTALFSVQKQGFLVLKPQPFDAEFLTSNVDAYKLGTQVAEAVKAFPAPSPLPHSLAGKASSAVAAPDAPVDVEVKVATRESGKPAPLPQPRPAGDRVVYPPANPAPYETGPLPPRPTSVSQQEGGVAWWVWALVGVGVAGAVGGAAYGISQATRPVTGTVSATW